MFPGEYGIPKPFYFFLMPSYWCGQAVKKQKLDDIEVNKMLSSVVCDSVILQMRQLDTSVGDSSHEQEPVDLTCGISIKGLEKKFKVEHSLRTDYIYTGHVM